MQIRVVHVKVYSQNFIQMIDILSFEPYLTKTNSGNLPRYSIASVFIFWIFKTNYLRILLQLPDFVNIHHQFLPTGLKVPSTDRLTESDNRP